MQSTSFSFTSFPDRSLSELLSAWLTMLEVARLDSAICRHGAREEFLRAAYSSETTLQYPARMRLGREFRNKVNAWTLIRSACVQGLYISSVLIHNHNSRYDYLQRRGGKLRWVQFEDCDHEYTKVCSNQSLTSRFACDFVQYCPNLVRVSDSESSCFGNEVIMPLVRRSPQLEELSAHGRKWTEEAINEVSARCGNLQKLVIAHLPVSGGCLSALVCSQRHLRVLHLTALRTVHGMFARTLACSCGDLEELKLTIFNMTLSDIHFLLAHCTRLRRFELCFLRILPSEGAWDTTASCSMRELVLTDVQHMAVGQLEMLLRYCSNLTYLEICLCNGLRSLGTLPVGALCPALETLSISSTAGDPLLFNVSRHCPRLRVLDIAESTAVTDAGIGAVAAGCLLLEELNLDSMKITNASLAAIAFLCHRLIALNVCGCNKITSTGVKQVIQHCPRLEVLGVEACEHVPWKLKSEVMRQYKIFW